MHLHDMTVRNRMVLQGKIDYKIKCGKGELTRCLSGSLSFRLLRTTYSHIIGVCKLFSCNAKQHMPFWLLKGAWLTCNGCSFSVLPTPFWSPIRHLFGAAWQAIDLLLFADLLLVRVFYICSWFIRSYVMVFQNPVCIFNVWEWKGFCIGGWQ